MFYRDPSHTGSPLQAYCHDLANGKERRLAEFDRLLHLARFEDSLPWELMLSPSRKWILLPASESRILVLTKDGASPYSIPMEGYVCWLGNGDQFAQFVCDTNSVAFPPDTKGTYSWMDIYDAISGKRVCRRAVPATCLVNKPQIYSGYMGIRTDNTIVRDTLPFPYEAASFESPKSVTVRTQRFEEDWGPILQHKLQFPDGARLRGISYSPHFNSIAWVFKLRRVSILDVSLRRLFPSHKLHPSSTEELWISKVDGTEMRQLGYEKTTDGDSIESDISEVKWSPDENRISYIYKDKLWIVTAR